MSERPSYVEGAAIIEGLPAWVLARLLPREKVIERLRAEGLSDRRIEPVLEAVDAIRCAGEGWHARASERAVREAPAISDCGSSEVPIASEPSRSQTMTTTEAARLIRRSDRRVRQLIDAGELPARRVGARWALDAAAVVALADERSAAA